MHPHHRCLRHEGAGSKMLVLVNHPETDDARKKGENEEGDAG
jgi:hypothetical protein